MKAKPQSKGRTPCDSETPVSDEADADKLAAADASVSSGLSGREAIAALPTQPLCCATYPPQPLRCTTHPPRPLLLWDGQCAFCERWAQRGKRLAGKYIDCQPYQQRMDDFPEIAPEQFANAVFLVLPDGRAYHSAEAVYRVLALRRPFGIVLWLYHRCPHFARFSDRRYRVVALARHCR